MPPNFPPIHKPMLMGVFLLVYMKCLIKKKELTIFN